MIESPNLANDRPVSGMARQVVVLRDTLRKRIAVQDAIPGFVILIDKPQPAGQACLFDKSALLKDALRGNVGNIDERANPVNTPLGSQQLHKPAGRLRCITLVPVGGRDDVTELDFTVLVKGTNAANQSVGVFKPYGK